MLNVRFSKSKLRTMISKATASVTKIKPSFHSYPRIRSALANMDPSTIGNTITSATMPMKYRNFNTPSVNVLCSWAINTGKYKESSMTGTS